MGKNSKILKEQAIFLPIPENTVRLTVTATVITQKGKTKVYTKELDHDEINECREYYLDHSDDVRCYLTQEGEEYLKELENNGR